eukprot:g4088.t1
MPSQKKKKKKTRKTRRDTIRPPKHSRKSPGLSPRQKGTTPKGAVPRHVEASAVAGTGGATVNCRSVREAVAALERGVSSVQLWFVRIDTVEAGAIAAAVRAHPKELRGLFLQGNGLDAKSCAVVVEALAGAPLLEAVAFSSNGIGDTAIAHLCTVLRGKRLRYVNVASTAMGNAGAEALGQLVRTLPQLESVEFHGNPRVTNLGETQLALGIQAQRARAMAQHGAGRAARLGAHSPVSAQRSFERKLAALGGLDSAGRADFMAREMTQDNTV